MSMNKSIKLARNSKVSVIGGGISGLSFAYFLGKLRPDVRIKIFEKQGRVGGYINTVKANEETRSKTGLDTGNAAKMEKGPRTLRGVSSGTLIIVDLLNKMGLLGQLRGISKQSEANKKYLLTDASHGDTQIGEMRGRLLQVPGPGTGIGNAIKIHLNFFKSKPGKAAFKGFFNDLMFFKKETNYDVKMLDNMSVETFFKRHFGSGMMNEMGSALMYGIYAADVKDMNVNCVMPKMVELEKATESGSIVKATYRKIKDMLAKKKEDEKMGKKISNLDEDVNGYLKRFGSDFNLENLSVLLKRFPMLMLGDGLSVLCEGLKNNMPGNVEVVIGDGIKKIAEKDGKMIIESEKGDVEAFDHVRSTINANILGKIIGGSCEKVSKRLDDFKYTSVTVCNVLIPRGDVKKYQGFGFLVPKAQFNGNARVIGVIFDSDVENYSCEIFPGSVPKLLLKDVVKDVGTDDIKTLCKEIVERDENENVSMDNKKYTKVTFMLNIDRKNKIDATDLRVRRIVQETFANILGGDLSRSTNWAIEKNTWWDSIPLYDIQGEGFPARKDAVEKEVSEEFGGKLSLGGMTFALGVGVPDNVVSSLRAAVVLAETGVIGLYRI